MPYANMAFQIAGELGIPMPLTQTLLNEALGDILDSQMWSFQLKESGWLTPGLLFQTGTQSAGTITATPYSDQIVGNATAAAAWVAYASMPLLTSFQIRSPFYSLYNIIAWDGVNTFTIDRPWMEPGGAGLAYMIYQAYFPVPVSDFKRFFDIRDTTNASPVDYWSLSQMDLAVIDPQRTNFNQPAYAVPYEVDARTNSATLGNMMYELYPQPLSQLPYSFNYLRRGVLLSAPSDTLPAPLTEDLVKWKTREAAYLWKESQKGDGVARGSGADFKFLALAAAEEFKKKKKIIADRDRDMVELYFRRFVRDAALGFNGLPFATQNGGLNVGRMV